MSSPKPGHKLGGAEEEQGGLGRGWAGRSGAGWGLAKRSWARRGGVGLGGAGPNWLVLFSLKQIDYWILGTFVSPYQSKKRFFASMNKEILFLKSCRNSIRGWFPVYYWFSNRRNSPSCIWIANSTSIFLPLKTLLIPRMSEQSTLLIPRMYSNWKGWLVPGCAKQSSPQETDLRNLTLHGSLHVWDGTAALSGPWGLIQRVPMSSHDVGLAKCETWQCIGNHIFVLFSRVQVSTVCQKLVCYVKGILTCRVRKTDIQPAGCLGLHGWVAGQGPTGPFADKTVRLGNYPSSYPP